jgi:hypothetical protein
MDSDNGVLRARVSRFLAVEKRRAAIGGPVMQLAAAAGVTDRSYRRWQDGDSVPSFHSLAKLEAGIKAMEAEVMTT